MNYNTKNMTRNIYVIFFFILSMSFSEINAQYSIQGTTNVNQGQTYTYTVTGSNIGNTSWSTATGGSINSQSGVSASVTWTTPGTGVLICNAVSYTHLTLPTKA